VLTPDELEGVELVKIKELIRSWESSATTPLAVQEYTVQLPIKYAARVEALVEMYPQRSRTQIVTDLLCSALDELESGLPYVRGDRVIAEDDHGDPVYEDVGPTPRFLELAQKYARELEPQTARDE
jgi:hypothetical protein